VSEAPRTGPVGIGIVGAGNISSQYLSNLTRFPDTTVLAIGDALPDVARAKAAEHGVALAGDAASVLDHPDVEIVVNLTVPAAHAEVALRAVAAGKHVWNEKPIALDRAAAAGVLEAASAAGVRVGCAPDTFLGEGLQAVRRLLDEDAIGRPLTALALMQSPGPDAWHPNPAFLFQTGAGPLFDIGPYYLTALVHAFGAVGRVGALASTARAVRVIGAGPRKGEPFDVTAPSHVAALVEFVGGGSAQVVFSFDSGFPRTLLEVNGTDGTLISPDPNEFDGDVSIRRPGVASPEPAASTHIAFDARDRRARDGARTIRLTPHGPTGRSVPRARHDAGDRGRDRGAGVVGWSHVAPAERLPADWDPFASTLEEPARRDRADARGGAGARRPAARQAAPLPARCFASDPNNVIAIVGLARVALERGDERTTYVEARRALALDPENPAAAHLSMRMAEILQGRGETLPAIEDPAGPPAGGPTSTAPATAAPATTTAPGRRGLVDRFLRRPPS
jgi:predicted dehydrogenase